VKALTKELHWNGLQNDVRNKTFCHSLYFTWIKRLLFQH